MLRPEDIDNFTEIIGVRYDKLQDLLMQDIMDKVRKGLAMGGSVQWDVQKILEAGGAWDKQIVSKIEKATGLAKSDVEKIMKQAGLESIREDNKRLPNNHQLPHKMTKGQLRVIMAGINNVNGAIGNMANVAIDSTLGLYSDLLSQGYTMMASGAFTLEKATQMVGTELVKQGVKGIEYASGRKDRIEVAVRRAMRTSTNQTMLKLGEQNAEELGTDLVEVTAHSGARPSHALWQGQVYSLSGKTRGYKKLSEATGYGTLLGLGGVNCRHNFFPYFKGFSEKEYKPQELKSLADEKVTVDGKEITMYQATQKMRGLERKMRDQLRLQEFAQKDTTAKQLQLKAQIKSLERQTGLRSNRDRYQIFGEGLPKPPKPQKPKRDPILNKKYYDGGIAKTFGKDFYDSFQPIILNSKHPNAPIVWKKFEGKIDAARQPDRGAHCEGLRPVIHINEALTRRGEVIYGDIMWQQPYQVLFHEGGHAIDQMLGRIENPTRRRYFSCSFKDGVFAKTITQEVDDHIKALAESINKQIEEHILAKDLEWFADHDYVDWGQYSKIHDSFKTGKKISVKVKIDNVRRAFANQIADIGDDYIGDLSDMIEGATYGKVKCGYGHEGSYWKDRQYWDGSNDGLAKEAFAEMMDATMANPKNLETIKKYLPKSYKIWEEMMEYAKGVKI